MLLSIVYQEGDTALFYDDIPADGVSELAALGETHWDFPTSIYQVNLLALTECAFCDLTILN